MWSWAAQYNGLRPVWCKVLNIFASSALGM